MWDASRKCIELSDKLCRELNLPGWRKAKNWKKRLKGALRHLDKTAYRGGPDKAIKLEKATGTYLKAARELESKTRRSMEQIQRQDLSGLQMVKLAQLTYFHQMAQKHIDLVDRRLLQKETIPHEEKLFSLFEPHSELIKKGKRMPPIEFGHRLAITSEQHGLIVDYHIMGKTESEPELLPGVVDRVEERFGVGEIESMSVDQGFSKMKLRVELEQRLGEGAVVVMPKKGPPSALSRERESEPKWVRLKDRHAAVESDINSLEHHGLDRCPDKGWGGYQRYAGMGILSYNLHKIGKELQAKELEQRAAKSGRKIKPPRARARARAKTKAA